MKAFFLVILASACLSVMGQAQAETPATNAPSRVGYTDKGEFVFQGGNLEDFTSAIKGHFGADLDRIATIPPAMLSVTVPKMRSSSAHYRGILNLYSQIASESDPSMGKWLIKGTPFVQNEKEHFQVEAIILVRPESGRAGLASKAFALEVSDEQLVSLRSTVSNQLDLMEYPTARNDRLQYHPQTFIMVITGSAEYVQLVSAIVEAYRTSDTYIHELMKKHSAREKLGNK